MDFKLKVIKLNLKKSRRRRRQQPVWPLARGWENRAAAAPTLWNSETETLAVGQAHGCSKPFAACAWDTAALLPRRLRKRNPRWNCSRPAHAFSRGPRAVYGKSQRIKLYNYRRTVSVCMYGVQILVHAFVVFFVTFVVAVVVVPDVVVASIDASPRSSLPDCVFGCGLRADERELLFPSI